MNKKKVLDTEEVGLTLNEIEKVFTDNQIVVRLFCLGVCMVDIAAAFMITVKEIEAIIRGSLKCQKRSP